jgi:hypothetical protein
MSDLFDTAPCECPRCRRTFDVRWGWSLAMTNPVRPDYGEMEYDPCFGLTYAVRYPRFARCPTCGARLEIEHELKPEFNARRLVDDAD